MRLCIVSQEYPPVTDYWGGIGTQYGRLGPALAGLGHEVHAVVLAPTESPAPDSCQGVSVHPLVRPRMWPWFAWAWARRVDGFLRELGEFDVVLAPDFRSEAAVYARHQRSGPLVTHLLTSLAQLLSLRPGLRWRERHGPGVQISLALERRQARHSAALLAPGSAVLDWARSLWSLDGIPSQVLPLAIDVQAVRRDATGALPEGFPRGGGPVVSLASRLDGHKGAQHLVSAMHRVWRRHPEAQLAFIGRDAPWRRGMMSDHLRSLAGDRVDQVHVLGYQPPESYFSAVAASDVVAIPSLWESFCLAAVEAMALGRPVIGTRGHGFSEFIVEGQNGLLVDRGSVDQLADALATLLDDAQLRARLGARAQTTAEGLDAERLAPRYVEVLSHLV